MICLPSRLPASVDHTDCHQLPCGVLRCAVHAHMGRLVPNKAKACLQRKSPCSLQKQPQPTAQSGLPSPGVLWSQKPEGLCYSPAAESALCTAHLIACLLVTQLHLSNDKHAAFPCMSASYSMSSAVTHKVYLPMTPPAVFPRAAPRTPLHAQLSSALQHAS